MISKPISPPWNDSSKNLVKDIVQHGQQFSYHVLTQQGFSLPGEQVISEPIYSTTNSLFSPSLQQNLRVGVRLLRKRDRTNITHYFFAPNPSSSKIARLVQMYRRCPTVQTVCSIPQHFTEARDILFADKVVVLSDYTRDRFIEAGVCAKRLVRIDPGIQMPADRSLQVRKAIREKFGIKPNDFLAIYPGDYQFNNAAWTVAEAVTKLPESGFHVIFACRIKQEASRDIEDNIDAMLRKSGRRSQVTMLNHVDSMIDLLSACDICLLPADSLYAKMDYPLVLLEAMALGIPIIVGSGTPPSELFQHGDIGQIVPAGEYRALATAIVSFAASGETRQKKGERAQTIVKDHFEISKITHQYEQLYSTMLNPA